MCAKIERILAGMLKCLTSQWSTNIVVVIVVRLLVVIIVVVVVVGGAFILGSHLQAMLILYANDLCQKVLGSQQNWIRLCHSRESFPKNSPLQHPVPIPAQNHKPRHQHQASCACFPPKLPNERPLPETLDSPTTLLFFFEGKVGQEQEQELELEGHAWREAF